MPTNPNLQLINSVLSIPYFSIMLTPADTSSAVLDSCDLSKFWVLQTRVKHLEALTVSLVGVVPSIGCIEAVHRTSQFWEGRDLGHATNC